MTTPTVLEGRDRIAPLSRPPALFAVAAARVLSHLPPAAIRGALDRLRRGALPATHEQAATARGQVVAVSRRCAAQQCVQRSLATVILCRLRGTWVTWHAGVRMEPFLAHAWVSVDGEPVGEPESTGLFRPIMTVPSGAPHGSRGGSGD